ncbi:MAG: type I restriction-modification enzyme R subunit C-terminal domain-containing protein [Acidovorax sp.]|nr:type I restriction-modification enzyme R subunit C-terminal domain-containing protein [Acidovorax sp.]
MPAPAWARSHPATTRRPPRPRSAAGARARTLHTSLPVFIRSLVGLEREAAAAAFANLVSSGTATASQLQFIEEIVQHLTEHGAMPAARLYESPFTDIHAQGPDGVFEAAKVELLFKALEAFDPLQKVA